MINQLYIKEHSDKKNIFSKNYTDNIRDFDRQELSGLMLQELKFNNQ